MNHDPIQEIRTSIQSKELTMKNLSEASVVPLTTVHRIIHADKDFGYKKAQKLIKAYLEIRENKR